MHRGEGGGREWEMHGLKLHKCCRSLAGLGEIEQAADMSGSENEHTVGLGGGSVKHVSMKCLLVDRLLDRLAFLCHSQGFLLRCNISPSPPTVFIPKDVFPTAPLPSAACWVWPSCSTVAC